MTKKERRLSVSQKRIIKLEAAYIAVTILGVILCVCNFFKIVPENNDVVMAIIAYGALIGPAMIMLGISTFLEVRDTKLSEFSKKAR